MLRFNKGFECLLPRAGLQFAYLLALAYGTRLDDDEALRSKVLADGAGRRPHGTPDWAPRRDARR